MQPQRSLFGLHLLIWIQMIGAQGVYSDPIKKIEAIEKRLKAIRIGHSMPLHVGLHWAKYPRADLVDKVAFAASSFFYVYYASHALAQDTSFSFRYSGAVAMYPLFHTLVLLGYEHRMALERQYSNARWEIEKETTSPEQQAYYKNKLRNLHPQSRYYLHKSKGTCAERLINYMLPRTTTEILTTTTTAAALLAPWAWGRYRKKH